MRNKGLLGIGLPVLMAAIIAVSAGVSALRGDTLLLRDGRSFEGIYSGGNERTIRFQVNGTVRYYSPADVDNIQFGPSTAGPELPPPQFVPFQNARFRIDRPSDWRAYPNGNSVTFAPPNARMGSGTRNLAYGAVANVFQPRPDFHSYGERFQGPGFARNNGLDRSMDELIDELRSSNPAMREVGARENTSVDGARALSVRLTNDSPVGGRETDWLVAAQVRDGMIYFLFTAPEQEFSNYESNVSSECCAP